MKNCPSCDGNHPGRRDFLRVGALSFLGMDLAGYLATSTAETPEEAKAQACILLWLDGGASHVDMWDPKPVSNFKPISTKADGIQISELFPRLAGQMDKISVIRSLHTEENNHGAGHHYA